MKRTLLSAMLLMTGLTLGLFGGNANAQTCKGVLTVNEFSNGPSGAKEWVELVVGACDSACAATVGNVDISKWIIDDNNGYFTNGTGSGLGIVSMRERAESIGGSCQAGPGGSGWLVDAVLPLAVSRRLEKGVA